MSEAKVLVDSSLESLLGQVAAVSCGLVGGAALLDLDYAEDSAADADANFVLTEGGIVEIQGTAEKTPFSDAQFAELMRLARLGPGEAFGEIALLLDVPRTATITASEPTRLLALEAHDFRDLLAGYLGRADELVRLSHLRLRTHRRLDEVV